eukprot:3883131-Prymnesium_polylepis.1
MEKRHSAPAAAVHGSTEQSACCESTPSPGFAHTPPARDEDKRRRPAASMKGPSGLPVERGAGPVRNLST